MIGPRRNNRMIYLNQAAPALQRIIKRRQQAVIDRLGPIYDRAQTESGKGLASNVAKAGLELGSKALGSEFRKKLINKGVDNIPNIFKFGASKTRNKNVRRAMRSDFAKMVVEEAQNKAKNKYESLFDQSKMGGISNYQIEGAF